MKSDADPWLLTPGPLSTTLETKKAMLHDWGSRDSKFIKINTQVCNALLDIANAAQTHVCVPLQGSGTFVVEATIGTLLPRHGKALVVVNGAYGRRMLKIIEVMGRACVTLETPEDTPPAVADIDTILTNDPDISHVLIVHCETTAGILNPVEAIAENVAKHRRKLIIDAMSAFGAIAIDAAQVSFDALMASSNKCLEGIPGLGFSIIRKATLEACEGNAHSLSLDLYDQWRAMEGNGQWRFTPPIHVIVAFHKAIEQFTAAGGVAGRYKRYAANCRLLIDGMSELGFQSLLSHNLQAPIIVTFKMPADPVFNFEIFYDKLKDRGYVIYPGKLTVAPSFRIGCIGNLGVIEIQGALAAVAAVMTDMGVANGAPSEVL